jgi:hypothetical protein
MSYIAIITHLHIVGIAVGIAVGMCTLILAAIIGILTLILV